MTSPSANPHAEMIRLGGVVKRFGNSPPALDGVSATIRAGEITGLVGPDGAGKTTLMRILTGLLVPDAGRVALAGYDVVRDNDAIHVVSGYMPQRFGLYEDLSVMENMRLYAQLRGLDAERNAGLFAELLDFTRLAPFTTRLAGRFRKSAADEALRCMLAKSFSRHGAMPLPMVGMTMSRDRK